MGQILKAAAALAAMIASAPAFAALGADQAG